MTTEQERFLVMFDGLVVLANDWIAATPADKLDWAPEGGDDIKFGDRISDVTIKNIYGHVTLSEYSWSRMLRDCADGTELGMDKNPEIVAGLESDRFFDVAKQVHADSMAIMETYGEAELSKSVIHTGRRYTGMGFLWAMYAHHAYHLGNIDTYLRLATGTAPDFFNFHRTEML